MKGTFALAACLVALSLASAARTQTFREPEYNLDGRHYQNMDYGFSIEIPDHLSGCVSEDGANHGVAILLDPRSHCGDDDRMPHINVYADYNMPGDADTPERLAQIDCPDPTAREVVFLKGWFLGSRKAAGCRKIFGRDKILVDLFTFRGARSIIVGADMITTTARYDRDMGEFRRLVQSIRVAPDEPRK